MARLVRGHSQAERAVGCFDRHADRDPGRSLDLRPWIGVGRVPRLVGCLATAESVARWHDGRRELDGRGAAARALPRDGGRDLRHAAVPRPARLCAVRRLPRGGLPHLAVRLCDGRAPGRRRLRDISPRLDQGTARSRDGGRPPGPAFAGIAIAAPFFAQLALLPAGEGSPYAVKKYAFGLITLLAVDLCVLVASLVPLSARLPRADGAELRLRRRARRRCDIRSILQPGHGYFTTQMVDLERRVEAVTSSGDLGDDRRDYAVELVGSDVWLDYMFTAAILRPHDRGPLDLHYLGKSGALLRSADQLVTTVGTRYDQAAAGALLHGRRSWLSAPSASPATPREDRPETPAPPVCVRSSHHCP